MTSAGVSGNIGDAVSRFDPAAPALTETDGEQLAVTYGELGLRIASAQQALAQRGVRPGDRVAIIGLNSLAWVVAFYAIMRAGAVAVPISHKLPPSALDFVLDDARQTLVLTDTADRAAGTRPILLDDLRGGDVALDDVRAADVVESDPAMVLYTSGSTGRPKGVVRSHGSHRWIMSHAEQGQHRTILVAAPLYHMNGLATVQGALLQGDHVILQSVFDAKGYLRAIADHRVTKTTGVPPMMALALREKALINELDLSSVTEHLFGSAPLSDELIDMIADVFPRATLTISYGTTETGPVAFAPHPDKPTPKNSVGVAHPQVRVRLLADDGTVLAEDGQSASSSVTGEITGNLALASPAEFTAYLNRTDRPLDAEGFYATGDLFRRDEEGFYFFSGRVDDMFVSGGENVHPAAVEKVLEEHPGVLQAVVVPVTDAVKGAKPVAFVIPKDGGSVSEQALKDWVLARMEPYAHPRHVYFVDEFPLSGTNKIDRKSLGSEDHDH